MSCIVIALMYISVAHSTNVVSLLGLSVADGGPTVGNHATGKMFFVELIRCMAVSVLLALYPPQTKNYRSHDPLTLVMLHCLFLFFIHLKQELLTQISASNDEKYVYLWKIVISKIDLFHQLSIYQKLFCGFQWRFICSEIVFKPFIYTRFLQHEG